MSEFLKLLLLLIPFLQLQLHMMYCSSGVTAIIGRTPQHGWKLLAWM